MKSTFLLTTALFLVSAPAPDSGDIAEMSSNFIVPENVPGLLADEQIIASDSPITRLGITRLGNERPTVTPEIILPGKT